MDQAVRSVVTLPQLMDKQLRHHPDAVAIIVDGDRGMTYAEWERRANAVAQSLLAAGVRPGDRIGLLAGVADWFDYAVAYLAAKKVAAATLHLSATAPPAEIARRLRVCDAVALISTSSVGYDTVAAIDPPMWTATVPELERQPADAIEPVSVPGDPDELAEIIFTSGTTGVAKAIEVTQHMLTWGLDLEDDVAEIEGESQLSLYGNPIGSSPGMLLVMTPMVAHPPTVIAVSRHDPDHLASLIERLRVQSVYVSPWIAVGMVNARVHERYDLSSVTEFTNASAALALPVARKLARMFPNATMNRAYVSLESVPAFTRLSVPSWAQDPEFFDRPEAASVGTPRFGAKVSIRDSDGNELPGGRVGEIWLSTPAPQRRYHRNPEANARTFVDGWIRMGDLGRVDEEGRLYVFDRIADAIASPRGPISSVAIEEVLYTHPAVAEAAVFAAIDPVTRAQAPVAAVVLNTPVPAEELHAFAARWLAPDQVPVAVHIADDLPRGTLGKVLKRELRKRFSVLRDAVKPNPAAR